MRAEVPDREEDVWKKQVAFGIRQTRLAVRRADVNRVFSWMVSNSDYSLRAWLMGDALPMELIRLV